jgi:hypothetical protein
MVTMKKLGGTIKERRVLLGKPPPVLCRWNKRHGHIHQYL